MERETLRWFQWAWCLPNYPRWEEFTKVLCQEFGPSELEDSAETLRQVGTLWDYVNEFRLLANRTRDINPSLLKSCFIRGLKAELRHDVKLLKPKDVLETSAFAQQIVPSLLISRWNLPINLLWFSLILDHLCKLWTLILSLRIDQDSNKVSRLTPEKVEHCRKNGLYFHCKEKHVRGHSCKKK